jgi:Protein of unknown function (DUF3489)
MSPNSAWGCRFSAAGCRLGDGATLKELVKAIGWQPHSIRGFLSGTIRKKMGLAVTSAKGDGGERSYLIKG